MSDYPNKQLEDFAQLIIGNKQKTKTKKSHKKVVNYTYIKRFTKSK